MYFMHISPIFSSWVTYTNLYLYKKLYQTDIVTQSGLYICHYKLSYCELIICYFFTVILIFTYIVFSYSGVMQVLSLWG